MHKETHTPLENWQSGHEPLRISSFDQQVWGQIDYALAVQRQLELVDAVLAGERRETLIFCSHPPVVTLGRTTPKSDLFGWEGAVIESSRGGRATYHGPSQLVVYPIVDLREDGRPGLRSRDVSGYIRLLGQTITEIVRDLGLEAELKQGQEKDEDGHTRQLTGVWVGHRKVASIGVAVRKWVTYHGVAINVRSDVRAFKGIRPCGFRPGTMTSLEELLGCEVSCDLLAQRFAECFEFHLYEGSR